MAQFISHSGSRSLPARLRSAGWALLRSVLWGLTPLVVVAMTMAQLDLSPPERHEAMQVARLASARFSRHPIRHLALAEGGRAVWVSRFPTIFQKRNAQTGTLLAEHSYLTGFAGNLEFTSPHRHGVVYACDRGIVLQSLDAIGNAVVLLASGGGDPEFSTNPVFDVIAFGNETQIHIQSLASMKTLATFRLPSRVSRLSWSPDGASLLVLEGNGTLHILDGETLESKIVQRTSLPSNARLLWSRNGRLAIAYADQGMIVAWDWRSNRVVEHQRDDTYIRIAAVTPDGSRMAYIDEHDRVWLLSLDGQTGAQLLGTAPSVTNALLFDADGDSLLLGGVNGRLECWSLSDGAVEWSVPYDADRPAA